MSAACSAALVLIKYPLRSAGFHHNPIIRACPSPPTPGFVLFFPAAAATYARLWSEYDDTAPQHDTLPQHDAQLHMASVGLGRLAPQPGGDYILEEHVEESILESILDPVGGARDGSTLEPSAQPHPPCRGRGGILPRVPLVAFAAAAARVEPRQPSPQRGRGRAVRWHYTSLLAAFATGAIVLGLLVAAELLDNQALWSALAYCTV